MANSRARAIAILGSSMALALIFGACPGAEAQLSPIGAPGPAPDCTPYLLNMSDCLNYVVAGSNQTKPDPGCCPELAGLVDSHPICLCQLLSKAGSFGVQLDINKALKLPSVCGVPAPSLNSCSAAGVPVSLPSPSEAPGPASSTAHGTASSPSGNQGNAAPKIAGSHLFFLVGLATAILSTFF